MICMYIICMYILCIFSMFDQETIHAMKLQLLKHHGLYTMTLDFLNGNYKSGTLHLKSKKTLHTIRNARQLEPTAANTMKLIRV